MKITYDKEQVLKTPGEKEISEQERNSPFAAEISEGDKHLDGIIEKDEKSHQFNLFKEFAEECEL